MIYIYTHFYINTKNMSCNYNVHNMIKNSFDFKYFPVVNPEHPSKCNSNLNTKNDFI